MISLIVEQIFYNDIDANGVVQESLFLPLTFIFLAAALIVLLYALIYKN